jgi:MFS family permease
MALHSMLGFAGGVFGPVMFGLVLDLTGGSNNPEAWTWAFAVLATVTLAGPLAMLVLRPNDLPGDGRRGSSHAVAERLAVASDNRSIT